VGCATANAITPISEAFNLKPVGAGALLRCACADRAARSAAVGTFESGTFDVGLGTILFEALGRDSSSAREHPRGEQATTQSTCSGIGE